MLALRPNRRRDCEGLGRALGLRPGRFRRDLFVFRLDLNGEGQIAHGVLDDGVIAQFVLFVVTRVVVASTDNVTIARGVKCRQSCKSQ